VYIPASRERVEVSGHTGVFIVVYVNQDDKTVDCVKLDEHAYLLSDVPFSLLQPYKPDLPPDGHLQLSHLP